MSRLQNFQHLDWYIIVFVTVLTLFGVVMIGSADGWVYDQQHFYLEPLMVRQLIGFGIGIFIIIVILMLPYRWLKAAAIPVYLVTVALLVLVLRFGRGAQEGDEVNRWLPIAGDLMIQPSEFAKIGMILMLAWIFDKFRSHRNNVGVIALAVVLAMVPLLLIYKEPDLSTTLVAVAIIFTCFFAGRVSWLYILPVIGLAVLAVYLVIHDALTGSMKLLNAYQTERILAWLHPEDYELTTAYQSMQSRIAIGAGGLFGKGLFHNSGMVPIASTDFIFGIIGEELGLVGASIVMILYFLLSIRILLIAGGAKEPFGRVVCASCAVMISIQALIHMGVCIAVLPNTGLPLPFISYGLSSLTANMAAVGLVLRGNAENYESKVRRFLS